MAPKVKGEVNELPSPAMVVDLDRLDRNLKLLADYFSTRHCKLRPHFKSHKCVTLARRQLAAGSCSGITCAKLSEMDNCYKKLRPEFENAMFVLATVISTPGSRVVVDVGCKGLGLEFGPPVIDGHPEAKILGTAEEHTKTEGISAKIGDRLRLIPSHGCTTSNLYRQLWVVRGTRAVDLWPIEGSGCLE